MKKIPLVKILFIILIVVWSATVFAVGFYQGYQQVPEPPKALTLEGSPDLSLLWETWNELEAKYPKPLNYQNMVYGAAKGLVASLGDPYTVFFKPDDSKMFKDDIAGAFEGIGAEISIKDGQLTVVAPLEGTPAKKAGILPGDQIIKVNGTSTKDISVDKAVKMIRGPKGSKVTLSIYREGWKSIKDFKIERGVIKIPSIKLEITKDGVAKVSIYQFSATLDKDFAKTAQKITKSSANKILLDLRGNPGGLLYVAQDVAGWFIQKGKIVTTEDFGNAKPANHYLAKGNGALSSYPTVILIDKGSASAAEILAAALRDNRNNVKLVGETSFGKGSVQEPINLRGGSLLKVTIAHWLTPKGNLIDGQGLKPDVEVKMTEEDYKNKKDPQMEKGLEILKNY